ncbi:MAG: hypothetical protein K8S87_02710 [Planctomycetes bacterium]|nr:hypothetical protein [Planctomycetota bacterium]
MSDIIRGKTNQKGCYVCGKPIQKMGESTLILKNTDGNIAFCSRICADKFDPETAKTFKKKSKSKKKIDSLLMASTPLKALDDAIEGIEKPERIKKVKKTKAKPRASSAKKATVKKATKKTPVKKASTSAKPAKKTAAKKASAKKTSSPKTKKSAPTKSSKPGKKK